jgi:hypothetical protein
VNEGVSSHILKWGVICFYKEMFILW